MKKYIAVDLGASTGRVIVGDLTRIEEINRFSSKSVQIHNTIRWDVLAIFKEIKKGLRLAFEKYGDEIASIGVDTWGVDYAFLDEAGELTGNPTHYRDARTDGMMEEFFKIIPAEEVYAETGIQFMQLNTLFQLFAEVRNNPGKVSRAAHYVSIPDLLNYWLTGVIANEFSHATTTQLFNPAKKIWSKKLIEAVGIDPAIFSDVVDPGHVIGTLLPELAESVGAPDGVKVIAPGCHDTASAVAAVPVVGGGDFAYLSSGTWSLLGIEADGPIINDATCEANFTNEGGVGGKIRFLKNIMGLWILQECKNDWDAEGVELEGKPLDWYSLARAADAANDTAELIDVNDPIFLKPSSTAGSMAERVKSFCASKGCAAPETVGEVARCIYRSLADKYKNIIVQIESLTGKKFEALHIIGGGSQNEFLNKQTAEALGIPVYAGPAEATAIGNILVQAWGLGDISSIEEGRRMVADNFDLKKF